MRTVERLTKLKEFVYKNLCKGRVLKAPGENMDITDITTAEPKVYLGFAPAWMDANGQITEDPVSVCPGILILPNPSHAMYRKERRFDRYDNVHRPIEYGQTLSVSLLFVVYEPGVRLPGFITSAEESGKGLDMTKILEGTEQGLFTLYNWMDDCKDKLLEVRHIPNTDLSVDEESITYNLYSDQNYVVDRRPLYYGFINVTFDCFVDQGSNREMNEILL